MTMRSEFICKNCDGILNRKDGWYYNDEGYPICSSCQPTEGKAIGADCFCCNESLNCREGWYYNNEGYPVCITCQFNADPFTDPLL